MEILKYLVALIASRPKEVRLLGLFFVGVLLPLVVLGQLAHGVGDEGFFWDDPTLLWIHQFATPGRDWFFLLLTQTGRALIVVPFCLALVAYLYYRGERSSGAFFAVAAFGPMLLSLAAKLFFRRDRPTLWDSPAPETTFSFPSGHAMGTMAITAAIIILLWRTRWRWYALLIGVPYVLLIGLSRMYLGVHYPSDILAGWCASLAWVIAVNSTLAAHHKGYWQRGWTYLSVVRVLFRRSPTKS